MSSESILKARAARGLRIVDFMRGGGAAYLSFAASPEKKGGHISRRLDQVAMRPLRASVRIVKTSTQFTRGIRLV